MSKTSDRQARHNYLSARLQVWAFERGFKLTDGDAYRPPSVYGEYGVDQGCAGYGNIRSQHKKRMARDNILFLGATMGKDGFLHGGEYATQTDQYRALGRYWESLHPECRWGGRYNDGNHFETVKGYDNRTDEPI